MGSREAALHAKGENGTGAIRDKRKCGRRQQQQWEGESEGKRGEYKEEGDKVKLWERKREEERVGCANIDGVQIWLQAIAERRRRRRRRRRGGGPVFLASIEQIGRAHV